MQIPESFEYDKKELTEEASFSVRPFINTAKVFMEEEIDDKLIKYVERLVRNSNEYRKYIKYLKDELDMTRCKFLEKIDCSEMKVSIEFHHFPITLYDIVETILRKHVKLANGIGVSCFSVASEVVKLHYMNMIGLVPLTKTAHELAHSKSLVIPTSYVYGNYNAFKKEYSAYMGQDTIDRIIDAEVYNSTDDVKARNAIKLTKKILKYDIEYETEVDVNEC